MENIIKVDKEGLEYLKGRYSSIKSDISNMQCNPLDIPGFLDVGTEINTMYNAVKTSESNIINSLDSITNVIDMTISTLENADSGILSIIDNFFTSLLGSILPSAKAEDALLMNGKVCNINEKIFETKWGSNCVKNGIVSIFIDDKLYTYNLKTGELFFPGGEVIVHAYCTEGYTKMPSLENLADPDDATAYYKATDRITFAMLLGGFESTSLLDNGFKLEKYGSTNEMFFLDVEKEPYTTYNVPALLAIAKFFPNALKANVMSKDNEKYGKFDCYAHSNAQATLEHLVAKDTENLVNGKLVGWDYGGYEEGNGRGQKVDQYTQEDISALKAHLKDNKQIIEIYDAKGGDSDNINYYATTVLGPAYCKVIEGKTGHGAEYFQKTLIERLGLYEY